MNRLTLGLRRPWALVALIAFTITAGLWADRAYGWAGQVAVSLLVWLELALLCANLPRGIGERLVACTWISGCGEIIASLVWGLYDYQFGNVPLFVPPGHALLYLGGLLIAERLPAGMAKYGPYLVPALAAPVVITLALTGQDLFSLPLFLLFTAFVLFAPEKRLYATMFMLALAMEVYGTATGNWAWRAHVPGTPLSTLNPPLAAGAFYCLLDWAVNLHISWKNRRRSDSSPRGGAVTGDAPVPTGSIVTIPLTVPAPLPLN
ncbi:MAG: putative rane protein [Betaproteobacteria bacterium]|nr:putative rane protein [Betaproteobacteria bacterium]